MLSVARDGTLDVHSPPTISPSSTRTGFGWSRKAGMPAFPAFQRSSRTLMRGHSSIAFSMALVPPPVNPEACCGSPSTCSLNQISPISPRVSVGRIGSGTNAQSAR